METYQAQCEDSVMGSIAPTWDLEQRIGPQQNRRIRGQTERGEVFPATTVNHGVGYTHVCLRVCLCLTRVWLYLPVPLIYCHLPDRS